VLSLYEAEYIAVTHCAHDVLWFHNLFAELGYPQESATIIFCDNQGTIAYTHDSHTHSKMKYISIQEYFICNCISHGLISIVYINGRDNNADIFTKPLGRVLHNQWVIKYNLHATQRGVELW
jgi:hypothetical protein